MRHTSYRRRSGLKVLGSLTEAGYGRPSVEVVRTPKVPLLDADDPNAVQCADPACGVFVARLSNGRPRAHARGGYSTNTRAGRYKCEGSGFC